MKKIILIISIIILFSQNLFSQSYPRMGNPNWVTNDFFEDFNGSFDRSVWDVFHNWCGAGSQDEIIFSWVDSPYTVNQNYGNLYLSARASENYTGCGTSVDFISGQVATKEDFHYGIYECSATFDYEHGSFPAFWLTYRIDCNVSHRAEIDIVELKKKDSDSDLDNNAFYKPIGCGKGHGIEDAWHQTNFDWEDEDPHTFKCVYTPDYIKFYVDNQLLHTYNNNSYDFPDTRENIYLSQQLWQYNGSVDNIVVPQTSIFHWVKVKQFFLAPEITCPDVICTTGNASLDVDEDAYDITWSLYPGSAFTSSLSGTGKTVNNITASGNYNGTGKITFNFKVRGESFSAEKEFGVKGPRYEDISFGVVDSGDNPANQYGGTWVLCPNTTYHIYVHNDLSTCSTSNYSWTVPAAWTQYYTYQNMISINTNSSPGGPISVNANTCCNNNVTIISDYMGTDYNCGYYYMTFTPNPTTSETTVEILKGNEKEKKVMSSEDLQELQNLEWEFDVYDQSQILKASNKKIKGNKHKLKVNGWKKGVYFIRAKIKDEIVFGKLIVEK
ncbi:MAG: family 16 glycosylhydrolase [Mariniphaga sp.]|nr:family 16 glycosylhydrolase [Mariniphaga sp.]